ncbi:MAG: ATP-binding protein [Aestuariivirga sp.]
MPIRTRLTLVFALLMAAVVAIAGAFVYGGLKAQSDQTIAERLSAFALELAADLKDGESNVLHDFGDGDTKGYFAQVLDAGGKILETRGATVDPLLASDELAKTVTGNVLEKSVPGAQSGEHSPAHLIVETADGNRFVVVGTALDGRNATLQQLSILLWLVGPALCLVASALAWLLSGAALRPVENLRQQASMITEGDLASRLPVPNTGDEIATLAITLNSMLARIEGAFERERRFVDDASHELRTPLGILKTELDLALRRARTKEELEAALQSAAEESERLNRLAENLLVLARADRSKLPLHRENVRAGELLHAAANGLLASTKERGLNLEVVEPVDFTINVDPLRIRQALTNLIVNAIAHSRRNGRIALTALEDGPKAVVLAVADDGNGFPESFIAKAFDPFTRADAGRSRRDGGTGLGLAIVKSIAEAHGGTAAAMNRPGGGAIVTMRFPK